MDTCTLIWVDLRVRPFVTDLCAMVRAKYQLRYVREPYLIPKLVTTLSPVAACFEYDRPGPEGLDLLRRTRIEFPGLPILMITVEHWEELAVWALRMKVCDYLIVPGAIDDLRSRLAALVGSRTANSREEVVFEECVPQTMDWPSRVADDARLRDRLLPAMSYVEANYSEKVALGTVARTCSLGRYQFSRIFKRVYGTTFREFLIAHRVSKAVRMLHASGASITDVAFSVGFNDLSHFAYMFRRYMGVSPSGYLQKIARLRRESPPDQPLRESVHIGLQNSPTLQRNPSSG